MGPLSFQQLGQLLHGLQVSLLLLATVTVVGGFVGAAMAYGHLSKIGWVRLVVVCVDVGLRGLPPVVLILMIYFGMTDVFSLNSFWAATLALGLRAGGYFGRIFKGAVLTVPKSQVLAGHSIGLRRIDTFLYVIVPQAYRHSLPGVANEISAQLKLTSLAFVVGVIELMRQAKYLISAGTGSLLGVLVITAAIYYAANALIFLLIGQLERRSAIPGLGAFRTKAGS